VRVLVLAATVVGALVLAPEAIAQPTPDRSCPPGQRCAVLSVPLDHAGRTPGTLPIFYRVEPARGPRTGTVVLLGEESDPFSLGTAPPERRIRRALREHHDLVYMDYRATGRSGPWMPCPSVMPRCDGFAVECPQPRGSADVVVCSNRLGDLRRFMTTTETARDLEDVRAALGAPQLTLIGSSSGARVAATYARLYPQRTAALVLDSPVPVDGYDALNALRQRPLGRVLSEVCGCPHPGAALARLVRRLPLRGTVTRRSGRTGTATLTEAQVYRLLARSDADERLRADLPGAIGSGAAGDAAPLLRLVEHYRGTPPPEPGEDDLTTGTVRTLATTCIEGRLPWAPDSPPAGRAAALDAALARDASAFAPFRPATVFAASPAAHCLAWQPTPRPDGVPTRGPAVPVLVLAGREDLRTPLEDARRTAGQYPAATLLALPGAGHFALHTDRGGCAAARTLAFLSGRSVRPCARPRRLWQVPPSIPAKLRGRPATAVALTLQAASHEIALYYRPPRRASFIAPGLRGGRMRAIDSDRVVFDRVQWIRGVRLSGLVSSRSIRLTVSGRASGRLSGTPARLRGHLGGRTVDLRLPSLREGEGRQRGIAGPAR
jgi:pimeloyl-ACP methyl ester carboxylesterase